MFERFDRDLRRTVVFAQLRARALGTEQIEAGHLLDALLLEARDVPETTAAGRVLALLGVDPGLAFLVSRTFSRDRRIGPLTEGEDAGLHTRGIDLDRLEPVEPEPPPRAGAPPRTGWWSHRKGRDASPESGATVDAPESGFSRLGKLALAYTVEEALAMGDTFFGTEHLLVGVVRVVDDRVVATLDLFGVDYARVRAAVEAADRRPVSP